MTREPFRPFIILTIATWPCRIYSEYSQSADLREVRNLPNQRPITGSRAHPISGLMRGARPAQSATNYRRSDTPNQQTQDDCWPYPISGLATQAVRPWRETITLKQMKKGNDKRQGTFNQQTYEREETISNQQTYD